MQVWDRNGRELFHIGNKATGDQTVTIELEKGERIVGMKSFQDSCWQREVQWVIGKSE